MNANPLPLTSLADILSPQEITDLSDSLYWLAVRWDDEAQYEDPAEYRAAWAKIAERVSPGCSSPSLKLRPFAGSFIIGVGDHKGTTIEVKRLLKATRIDIIVSFSKPPQHLLPSIVQAVLQARSLTGNPRIAVRAKAGKVQVVEVTPGPGGKSTVTPMSDFVSTDEAIKLLRSLQEPAGDAQ